MKSSISLKSWCRYPFILLILSITMVECKDNNGITPPIEEEADVWEAIQSNDNFNTLEELLKSTSLPAILSSSNMVSVFAPTNEAFTKLPESYFDGLTAQQLLDLLKYHISSERIELTTETYSHAFLSLQSDYIFVTVNPQGALVNNSANVTSRNTEAANGMIQAVDALLFPDAFGTITDNIAKRFQFSELFEKLDITTVSELLKGQGPLQLLAPENESIMLLEREPGFSLTVDQWAEILKYHILEADLSGMGPGTRTALATLAGDSVYLTVDSVLSINGYYTANWNPISANNGAIYYIDGIQLPDKYVDVLTLMGKRLNLKTVRNAFTVARLTGTLYDTSQEFTVFVPTDNSPGVNDLPTTETELAEVLKYHVLPVKLTADQIQDNQSYTTWSGKTITITKNGNSIVINGTATVRLADLEARNGVVHVIDGVLTPQN